MYNLHKEYEGYLNNNNLRFLNLSKPLIDIALDAFDW